MVNRKKVVAKKPAETAATPVASVPEKAEAPKTEKKTAAPKAEKKAEAPKTEKKTAAPKAEKKAAAPKAEKKAAAPKAEKKTAAKATSKFEIQFAGKNVTTEEIEAKFVETYGKKAPKAVKFYVKPEENKVYYVVDGDKEHGSFEL